MSILWHVLVTLELGGQTFRFARRDLDIYHAQSGKTYHYDGVLEHGTELPTIGVESNQFSILVPRAKFDIHALMRKGIYVAGAEAEVAHVRLGSDWSHRKILVSGRVVPSSIVRGFVENNFTISDLGDQDDTNFPPFVIQQGSFEFVADSEIGNAYNVIYGRPTEVPMTQISEAVPNRTSTEFAISCHRLGVNASIRPEGDASRAANSSVTYQRDSTNGAAVGIISLPAASDNGGDRNFVCSVSGHSDINGVVIERLGDVVMHAIQTYSGLTEDSLDHERLSRFRAQANRVKVASVFGGGAGDKLISSLNSRYGDAFGIKVDWRNGKLGADSLYYDPFIKPQRRLEYRRNSSIGTFFIERIDQSLAIIGEELPYSYFELFYDPNLLILEPGSGNPTFRKRIIRSWKDGDPRLVRAYSQYGELRYPPIQVVDVNTTHDAGAVMDWYIDRYAIQRSEIQYRAALDDAYQLMRFERYDITDEDLGWVDEPFRLETIRPGAADTAILTFSSFNWTP